VLSTRRAPVTNNRKESVIGDQGLDWLKAFWKFRKMMKKSVSQTPTRDNPIKCVGIPF
jgi:hypothetical protein